MAVGANLAFAPGDQSRFVKEGGYKIRPYVKNRIYEKQGRFPGPVFFLPGCGGPYPFILIAKLGWGTPLQPS